MIKKNFLLILLAISKKYKIFFITAFSLSISLLIIKLIPEPRYADGFNNLNEISQFASTLDEFMKMEGKNLANPTFEKYHLKQTQTQSLRFLNKILYILYRLKLIKAPSFSISFFRTILNDVSHKRRTLDWNGNFIQKIYLNSSSNIIVWGPIQGAFHSFVRCLKKLAELEIIDNNLEIRGKNNYLVILGNAINRSAFALETFSLILKLMKKNPYNVIYLKGTNEFPASWKNLSLGNELKVRAQQFSNISNSFLLENEVQSFFDSLPLALYGQLPTGENDTKKSFIKFTGSLDDPALKNLINEYHYARFLESKKNDKIQTFLINKQNIITQEDASSIEIKAVVCDIKKRDLHEQNDGLRLLPLTEGKVKWSILSCPTQPYREALNFFNDAFVIISLSKTFNEWEICLYKRDVRNILINQLFSTNRYLLFSGEQIK